VFDDEQCGLRYTKTPYASRDEGEDRGEGRYAHDHEEGPDVQRFVILVLSVMGTPTGNGRTILVAAHDSTGQNEVKTVVSLSRGLNPIWNLGGPRRVGRRSGRMCNEDSVSGTAY
jgi:hypothetical protein